jgi:hypothetical protein
VVPGDGHASKAGRLQSTESYDHASEAPVGRFGVVEDVAQPHEPVGLLTERFLDRPIERAEEVFLAEVSPLIVAHVSKVGAPKVGVPERDETGHYSANPFPVPSGFGGRGEGLETDFRYSS